MTNKNKDLAHIYKKMAIMNYHDTFGTIIMKNGMAFHVTHSFEYFREVWSDYKLAKLTGNTKKLKKILTEVGGVLSNGEIDLDLEEIAAAISIYKMSEKDEKFISFKNAEEILESIIDIDEDDDD